MKKSQSLVAVITISLWFFCQVLPSSAFAWTIAVDAGHGGNDTGAIGVSGVYEKDVNLEIATKLYDLLREDGHTVIMTREDDTYLTLEERCDIANNVPADVFVSIHNNSAGLSTVYGLETYYWSSGNDLSTEGKILAGYIQEETAPLIDTQDRGIKGANFYVLSHTLMPSALVEGGFLTNATEEAKLTDEDFQQDLAQGVHDGLLMYLENMSDPIPRIAGTDRFDTSSKISKSAFSRAESVLLATGTNFPDALSGGRFAGNRGMPLLLTAFDELSPTTALEIKRLEAERVYIIGGKAAVSENVSKELTDMGLSVERIYGRDRYETAARMASLDGVPSSGQAFIATGLEFPDALSAVPAAIEEESPMLLTQPDSLPIATRNNLKALQIQRVIIVGGTGAVSKAVEKELEAMGIDVERISGINRYDTSARIAETFFRRPSSVYLSNGENYPDALSIGPVAGIDDAPSLLSAKNELPTEISEYLRDKADDIEDIHIIGGISAVSKAVESSVKQIFDY